MKRSESRAQYIGKVSKEIYNTRNMSSIERILCNQDLLKKFNDRLKPDGEKLRKVDILEKDADAYLPTKLDLFWENFENICNILMENDERITAEDYLDPTYQILKHAAESKAINKILKPELWIGHVDEMEKLWHRMPEQYRDQVKDFAALKAKAESLSKTSTVSIVMSPTEHLEYVEKICKEIARGCYRSNLAAVIESSFQKDKLLQRLKEDSQKLTKTDFLSKNSEGYAAIQFEETWNKILIVNELIRQNNEFFTAEDFFNEYQGSISKFTLINRIGEKSAINKIFQPELWIDHVDEMEKLWQRMPEQYRDQVKDFKSLKARAEQLSLSSKTKPLEEKFCNAIRNKDNKTIADMLAKGFDPFEGKSCQESPLYLTKNHPTPETLQLLLNVLKEKYKNDPLKQINALDLRDSSDKSLINCQKEMSPENWNIFSQTVNEITNNIMKLDSEQLIARNKDNESVLDYFNKNHKLLLALLTQERWQQNPRELHKIGIRIPNEVKEKIGYSQILTRANANYLRDMLSL